MYISFTVCYGTNFFLAVGLPCLRISLASAATTSARGCAMPADCWTWTLHSWHVSKMCPRCPPLQKYWCGFKEVLINAKWVKQVDEPHPSYFFVSKKLGVVASWLRRWRYRMYLHRASFLHEAVLLRLLDPTVQVQVRAQLASAWGREILWRRSADAEPAVRERLASQLLALPLEKLLELHWSWYEPMMFQRQGSGSRISKFFVLSPHLGLFSFAFSSWGRRWTQLLTSGNRLDICAIDGNAQLHRRTCGQPHAEVVHYLRPSPSIC